MKKDVAKRVKVQPVFEGTILSKARKIIDRRGVLPVYRGKPVIAIDADGEEYNFQSCAEVERTTLISAGRIQSLQAWQTRDIAGRRILLAVCSRQRRVACESESMDKCAC